ncbi:MULTISPECIES: hypothetical protein [unclassified Clostridium]|uniref:hypothetical protein n=1 Tax=Clostridia TaxID=186801 RepID=UPI0018A8B881|nr:hypothetical protein [Clostridium sp. 1001270J_160509_D11]
MSRKNKGSILVVTVFVFLLVNIIAINCTSIVMSNIKYTKYNDEEIYLKEQCLSKIEIIYSNILKEVKIALDESGDYESFNSHFISDNSSEFINKINDLSDTSLDNKKCNITRINTNSENYIYYKIESSVSYNKFIKTIVAYIKIKNPFPKDTIVENNESSQEIQNSQELYTINQDDPSLEDKNIEDNNDSAKNYLQENSENNIEIETDKKDIVSEENENLGNTDEIKQVEEIQPSDLVIIYESKEV